jgi:hypothetical protein
MMRMVVAAVAAELTRRHEMLNRDKQMHFDMVRKCSRAPHGNGRVIDC